MQNVCVRRWWWVGGGGVEGICCSVTAYKGQETTGYESGSKPSGLFSFVLFYLIERFSLVVVGIGFGLGFRV